jgi:hypothetical protein
MGDAFTRSSGRCAPRTIHLQILAAITEVRADEIRQEHRRVYHAHPIIASRPGPAL